MDCHTIYPSCEREKTQRGGPQYEWNPKEENSYLWTVSCGTMFPIWDSGDIRFQELRKHFEAQRACSNRDKSWSHQTFVFNFSLSMHFIFKTWPLFFLHMGDFLMVRALRQPYEGSEWGLGIPSRVWGLCDFIRIHDMIPAILFQQVFQVEV